MSRSVAPGSTDQTIAVYCFDADGQPVSLDENSAGLTLAFRRDSDGREGTPVSMTPVVRSAPGVHTDGAITDVGDGKHEIDVADAGFVAGAELVTVELTADDVDVAFAEQILLQDAAAGGDLQVLPVVTTVNLEPVPPKTLTGYFKADSPQSTYAFQADGVTPYNLSGKTLQAVLSNLDGTEIGYIDAVTVSGPSNNKVSWVFPASFHQTAGRFRYAVREPSGTYAQFPWVHGEYFIQPVAGPHVVPGP